MASITWSDVTAHVPTLAGVAVAAQDDILGAVNTQLAVELFGGETAPLLRMARIYLCAHEALSSIVGASGSSGTVTSQKMGNVAVGYGSGPSGGGYESTRYGQMYLNILSRLPLRGSVV